MIIKVTQEDIDNGYFSTDECPIALAICRQLHEPEVHVLTTHGIIRIGYKVYKLPTEAKEWANAFDSRRDVTPTEFDIPDLDNNV